MGFAELSGCSQLYKMLYYEAPQILDEFMEYVLNVRHLTKLDVNVSYRGQRERYNSEI